MRRNSPNEGHERANYVDVVLPAPSAPLSPVASHEDIETVIPDAVIAEEQVWYDWRNISPGGTRLAFAHQFIPTGSEGTKTQACNSGQNMEQHSSAPKQKKTFRGGNQDGAYFSWMLLLLMACLLVWEFDQNNWSIEDPKINPMLGPQTEVLIDSGARRGDLVIVDGEWWRLLSSIFIHAGLVHYIISVALVANLGSRLERTYGWVRVMVVFVFGALFSSAIGLIFVPTGLALGSTAGFITLYGAEFGSIIAYGRRENDALSRCLSIIWIIAVTLTLGIMPLLDNWATAAGALIGMPLGLALLTTRPSMKQTKGNDKHRKAICILATLVALGAFIASFVTLYTRIAGPWCGNGCVNFTCVELPKSSENPWWYCDMCHMYGFEYSYKPADGNGYITCPDESVVGFTGQQEDSNVSLIGSMLDICISECTNLNFGFGVSSSNGIVG